MANSNQKGKRGEREAAKELARVLGISARRGVQYAGGTDSPDIVTDLDGLHFEVKRTERLNLHAAMEQARHDAGHAVPVVLHKANRRPWMATILLDDLPGLVLAIQSIGV